MEQPRIRDRKPTIKQIKALKFKAQGYSARASLLKAGYSENVANTSTHYFNNKGMQLAVASIKGYLNKMGKDDETIASKISEFIDAKRVTKNGDVADYPTQIQGVKIYLDLDAKKPQDNLKKREMTITEYITGEEEPHA